MPTTESVIPSRAGSGPSTARSLYEREDVLARLGATFEAVVRDQALGIVAIPGEAGLGKTRLLIEFESRLRSSPGEVTPRIAYARALTENSVGNGYQVIREALSDIATEESHAEENRLERVLNAFRVHAPNWLEAVPVAGALLGAAAATAQTLSDSEAPRLASSMNRQFGDLVIALAEERPLVLLLDDLQWADSSSADLLFYVSEYAKEYPILLVFAFRDEMMRAGPDAPPLRRHLLRMERYCSVEWLDLPRLSVDAIAAIAQERFEHPLPAQNAATLREHSQGNPLFVHEYLAGLGTRGSNSAEESLQIPRRIEVVLEERLEQLPADERRVIDIAATLGQVFDPRILIQVCDVPEDRTRAALRSMTKDPGLLVPARLAERPAYAFAHGLIATWARQRLAERDPFDFESLNLVIAETLKQNSSLTGSDHFQAIALHLSNAGQFREAASWYEKAAGEMQRIGAAAEAARALLTALDCEQSGPESNGATTRRRRALAQVQQDLMQHEAAAESLAGLEAYFCLPGTKAADQVGYYLDVAKAFRMAHRWPEAKRAVRLAGDRGAECDAEVRAMLALYTAEIQIAGVDRDLKGAEESLKTARSLSEDPWLRAAIIGHEGILSLARGDVSESGALFARALTTAEECGRPGRIYEGHIWLMKWHLACLRTSEALDELDVMKALMEQHEIGDRERFWSRDRGRVLALSGELDQSAVEYLRYLEAAMDCDPSTQMRALTHLAEVLVELAEERSATEACGYRDLIRKAVQNSAIPTNGVLAVEEAAGAISLKELGIGGVEQLLRASVVSVHDAPLARAQANIFTFHIGALHQFRADHGFSL